MRAVESNIDEARALHHELSLCNALAKAVSGRASRRRPGRRRSASSRCCSITRRAMRSRPGRRKAAASRPCCASSAATSPAGVQALRAALGELPGINFSLRYTALLGELAEALGHAGELEQGLADHRRGARALRAQRRALVHRGAAAHQGRADPAGGRGRTPPSRPKGTSQQGLDWARRQGALSWELRCATSLARLWHAQGSRRQARELLELGVRPLHRGLRQRRSGRGEKAAGDARVVFPLPSRESNRVLCQAVLNPSGFQGVLVFSMALRIVSSLRMHATMATLNSLPAARSLW